MALDDYTQGEKAAIGGAGLSAVAAFLPWMKVSFIGTITVSGIDGDGVITLVVALAVLGLVVLRDWDRMSAVGVLLGGLIIAGIGLLYISDPTTGVDTSGVSGEFVEGAISPAIGLYLTALGGLVTLAGGALGLSGGNGGGRRQQPRDGGL